MRSYSKRQLYALGETLGDSATVKKVGGGRIFGGGGSGGGGSPAPAPTQSTTNTSNIPEYAQPYVETMLGTTQQQIYNYDADNNVTGLKPYQAYNEDPSKYVAPFSTLQNQAQQGVANLTMPGQYGTATAGAMQGTGQALNAGNQYNMMATNPNATQAFMNPYLQASLQPQLQEINRQYDITGTQQQSAATAKGAFGGSREALMAAENQRNKNTAMNQVIGQGYNNAFQAAQQAQQYGAGLGLQGSQVGIAGANALSGIGGGQLNAQQNILNAQNTIGAAQTQREQDILNQGIQNYAMQQQYPMQQLAFMNAQIRGLPMQATTTQAYQAPPSSVSQVAGLGTAGIAGLGLYNAMNKGG
jgi:hypothetical protein